MATMALRQPLVDRVSWGALFAGFFFGFGIWMILLALGAGIGIFSFDPRDLGQWQGLGVGFGVWGVISGVVAMFVAGWLAARLSVSESRPAGMLHGAALWGFMIVAGLWIATMAVVRTAGAAAEVAGSAAQASAQSAELQQEIQQQAGQARQKAEGLRQQAEARKDEAASTAKKAGATGSLAFFVYGLLTLAAAMLGGLSGVPKDRIVIAREETVPPPGAPPFRPSPQRA